MSMIICKLPLLIPFRHLFLCCVTVTLLQVTAAEEGSESYTQAKEAATAAEEEAVTGLQMKNGQFSVRAVHVENHKASAATALEESLAEFKARRFQREKTAAKPRPSGFFFKVGRPASKRPVKGPQLATLIISYSIFCSIVKLTTGCKMILSHGIIERFEANEIRLPPELLNEEPMDKAADILKQRSAEAAEGWPLRSTGRGTRFVLWVYTKTS